MLPATQEAVLPVQSTEVGTDWRPWFHRSQTLATSAGSVGVGAGVGVGVGVASRAGEHESMQLFVKPMLAVPPGGGVHSPADAAMLQVPAPLTLTLQQVTGLAFRPHVERQADPESTLGPHCGGNRPAVISCLTRWVTQFA